MANSHCFGLELKYTEAEQIGPGSFQNYIWFGITKSKLLEGEILLRY